MTPGPVLVSIVVTPFSGWLMTAVALDPDLLGRYGAGSPCLDSYPEPRTFRPLSAADFHGPDRSGGDAPATAPLALYVRLAGRQPDREPMRDAPAAEDYFQVLKHEIAMVAVRLGPGRRIEQLYLDGGAQFLFSDEQIQGLLDQVDRSFGFSNAREMSIELDPRAVDPGRLARLLRLGFLHFAMRVRDVDATVQAAIKRLQGPELGNALGERVEQRRAHSISLELVYGAPDQAPHSFELSLDHVVGSQADRISLRPFRHAPVHDPGEERKRRARSMALLSTAITRLTAVGYVHIGMDCFVRPGDELADAMVHGRLQRGLHGYSARPAIDRLGVGVGSLSRIGNAYGENARSQVEYVAAIVAGEGATARGWMLSAEDLLRSAVIDRILCGRELRYGVLYGRFGVDARRHFRSELATLAPAARDGLVDLLPDRLHVTAVGRFFLCALARTFDSYRGLDVPAPRNAPRAAPTS